MAELIAELANQPVGDSRIDRARVQLLERARRWTTRGPLSAPAEIGWGTYNRLQRAGSSALPALFAYRIFVFALPLALTGVLILGIATSVADVNQNRAVERFGLAGSMASSIANAAPQHVTFGTYVALVGAVLVTLYATYSLTRAVRAIHAMAWGLPFRVARTPLTAVLLGLGALVAIIGLGSVIRGAADSLPLSLAIVVVPLLNALYVAAWLAISAWLPNRAEHWTQLLPGAIVVGIALAAIHAFVGIALVNYLKTKEETYGVLGLAAGLLLTLYALGWAIAAGATLNAELVARKAIGRTDVTST
ncbi:MAG TPA: YhjD/YihY/BrkB family envelope integrity protein [Gaiellaceae bacterium]|nr:YhjD/YihY/BrkB family envelope integrity protein [Gaiellaceae bacterium]